MFLYGAVRLQHQDIRFPNILKSWHNWCRRTLHTSHVSWNLATLMSGEISDYYREKSIVVPLRAMASLMMIPEDWNQHSWQWVSQVAVHLIHMTAERPSFWNCNLVRIGSIAVVGMSVAGIHAGPFTSYYTQGHQGWTHSGLPHLWQLVHLLYESRRMKKFLPWKRPTQFICSWGHSVWVDSHGSTCTLDSSSWNSLHKLQQFTHSSIAASVPDHQV